MRHATHDASIQFGLTKETRKKTPVVSFVGSLRRGSLSSTPNSHLNRHRHRSTATQAQRRQSSATAPAAQFVDQSGQDARAAGANGMAQRNRSTVNVYARPIPVEFFTIRQGLRRKGFVDLDQVKIAELEPRAL